MNKINLCAFFLNLFSQYGQKIEALRVDGRRLGEEEAWAFFRAHPEFSPVSTLVYREHEEVDDSPDWKLVERWEGGEIWPSFTLWTTDYIISTDVDPWYRRELDEIACVGDKRRWQMNFVARNPDSRLPTDLIGNLYRFKE